MQEIKKANPLLKHFRQPAIHIGLTSGGRFWPEGSLELPVTGKIPVLPMTTRDEITLRTPDALINGTSVVDVIESCCPNIKNAWDMPSVDVDSTLIAIRIASYGTNMTISSRCPHCEEEHDYDINLSGLLDKINMPDYSKPVQTQDELEIFLKPMSYRNVSRSGEVALEEQRLIQTLANTELSDDERNIRYEAHMKKMIELSVSSIVYCTDRIVTEDGTVVNDEEYIKEYYSNADSSVIRIIREQLDQLSEVVNLKPMPAVCDNCEKPFDINVQFDYASFFGRGF
jgi:hypothetical protein